MTNRNDSGDAIKQIRRLSSKVNAYFDRLFEFPDNLIPGFSIEEDRRKLEMFFLKHESAPILLEFGSGSGAHLIELASLKPEYVLLGFEIRFKRSVRTIEKALEQGISNLLVYRGRSELAPDLLGSRKVHEVYINFPDPWEKKRWRKHRILSSRTLLMLDTIMHPDAVLSVKTDHEEYFRSFLQEFQQASDLPFEIECISENLLEADRPEAAIRSEFEKLFRSQNKPVYYVRFRHKPLR
jgi:tRNA (guanine-N7-)-methyltransferase